MKLKNLVIFISFCLLLAFSSSQLIHRESYRIIKAEDKIIEVKNYKIKS